MQFNNLGSGSGGNATLVRAHERARPVMIDCGLGIRELERRVLAAGVAPQDVAAVFITHEHGDHAGCVSAWSRKYDCPIYLSRGTWHALGDPQFGGGMQRIRDGEPVELADLHITPFTVPHDAREPLQFRLHNQQRHLGVLTDLGHVSSHVCAQLQGVHSLILECNHDPEMLQRGPYPASLKRRVGGDWGHLSNQQAASVLAQVWHETLTQVIAAHLSEANNQAELALAALHGALPDRHDTRVHVAQADVATTWLSA
jgi:phosphoribosyl 1,2-cyclic phosphodiesterase